MTKTNLDWFRDPRMKEAEGLAWNTEIANVDAGRLYEAVAREVPATHPNTRSARRQVGPLRGRRGGHRGGARQRPGGRRPRVAQVSAASSTARSLRAAAGLTRRTGRPSSETGRRNLVRLGARVIELADDRGMGGDEFLAAADAAVKKGCSR